LAVETIRSTIASGEQASAGTSAAASVETALPTDFFFLVLFRKFSSGRRTSLIPLVGIRAESVTFSFDFQEEAPQIRAGNFQDFAYLFAGETFF
jgi:hypothetical protein